MNTLKEEIQRINYLSGNQLNEMMSVIPTEISSNGKITDAEILRVGIIAELDAVNLYQQMADKATSPDVKKLLLDIAKEEKTHVGEFEALLLKLDKQQASEIKTGEKEVADLLGKVKINLST